MGVGEELTEAPGSDTRPHPTVVALSTRSKPKSRPVQIRRPIPGLDNSQLQTERQSLIGLI